MMSRQIWSIQKMTGTNNITEEDRQRWLEGWTTMMRTYWIEKMNSFNHPVHDTGRLQSSINGMLHPGSITTIEHHFLEYGIFVARGSSPAFAWKTWTAAQGGKVPRSRLGSGHLEFLDPDYRQKHHLNDRKKVGPVWGVKEAGGIPIGPRDWFAKKYVYSLHRLDDFEANFFGVAYNGLLSSALFEMFNGGNTTAKNTLHHLL